MRFLFLHKKRASADGVRADGVRLQCVDKMGISGYIMKRGGSGLFRVVGEMQLYIMWDSFVCIRI